jgi:glutamine synthetase
MFLVEYIWYDGALIRGKTKVFKTFDPQNIPEWYCYAPNSEGYETKSTLKPVQVYNDYGRGTGCYIVLCEVMNDNNHRDRLNELLPFDIKIGFEQEYLVVDKKSPIQFIKDQSEKRIDIYCGVGSNRVIHRELAESHLKECVRIGVDLYGMNSETYMGQWEYQINHGNSVLKSCDDLIVSRYILLRQSEKQKLEIYFESTNGCDSTCQVNFSLANVDYSQDKIEWVFKENHHHIMETLKAEDRFKDFLFGIDNRESTLNYRLDCFEYRLPPANVNPYLVCSEIIKIIKNII